MATQACLCHPILLRDLCQLHFGDQRLGDGVGVWTVTDGALAPTAHAFSCPHSDACSPLQASKPDRAELATHCWKIGRFSTWSHFALRPRKNPSLLLLTQDVAT